MKHTSQIIIQFRVLDSVEKNLHFSRNFSNCMTTIHKFCFVFKTGRHTSRGLRDEENDVRAMWKVDTSIAFLKYTHVLSYSNNNIKYFLIIIFVHFFSKHHSNVNIHIFQKRHMHVWLHHHTIRKEIQFTLLYMYVAYVRSLFSSRT